MFDESELAQLLDLVEGKGPFSPSIRTYAVDDEPQRLLHEAFLELERRGQVVRYNAEDNWVLWMPVDSNLH